MYAAILFAVPDARTQLTTLAHDLGFEVTGWADALSR